MVVRIVVQYTQNVTIVSKMVWHFVLYYITTTQLSLTFQVSLLFVKYVVFLQQKLMVIQEDGLRNIRLAFNVAEEQLEIPQLLDSSDISKGLADERSVMTYLSMIRRAFEQRTSGPSKTPRGQASAVRHVRLRFHGTNFFVITAKKCRSFLSGSRVR